MSGRPGTGNPWNGLIVLCAGMRWDDVKMADRHMAEHLIAHGPVLYVDPPISRLTRFRQPRVATPAGSPRLQVLRPGLARLSPLVPPKPRHPAVLPAATRAVRRQLSTAVRALGGSVRAVISTWLFFDAYGVCGEDRRVYWWTDDPVGAAELWGHSAQRLAAAEDRLATASDLVVAVNQSATERLRQRGLRAEYVPNGCDAASFAAVDQVEPAPDVCLPGPLAGFVGHLNRRTDLVLLERVADSGMGLLLIGPRDPAFEPDRFQRLTERPNVRYVGARPFESLPAYMKLIDVGLVPYADSQFNRWSFPMKTLEYLAAGRPVVATSLPATRSLATNLITLADTPDDFAAAVIREAGLSRDPELVAARRAFARTHSWADRADRLVRLLERHNGQPQDLGTR